jgi:AraC-like DNA-binding protein
MIAQNTPNLVALTEEHLLSTAVEHRNSFQFSNCELNVFETHQVANRVDLTFNAPVVASMLRGKKVMHLHNMAAFDFYPGESLILPSHETMVIDFPEARSDNPTQCIALAISEEFIRDTVTRFNEHVPKCEDGDAWDLNLKNYHLNNSNDITNTLNRLIYLSRENNDARETFAGFALNELLLRLMQTQARHLFIEQAQRYMNNHRLAYVIYYIREHLTEKLNMDKLSSMACMSRPHFFRSFKKEFGISPLEFILEERIKMACRLLHQARYTVMDVALRCGFNNLNHFVDIFRRITGHTPANYRVSNHRLA